MLNQVNNPIDIPLAVGKEWVKNGSLLNLPVVAGDHLNLQDENHKFVGYITFAGITAKDDRLYIRLDVSRSLMKLHYPVIPGQKQFPGSSLDSSVFEVSLSHIMSIDPHRGKISVPIPLELTIISLDQVPERTNCIICPITSDLDQVCDRVMSSLTKKQPDRLKPYTFNPKPIFNKDS